MSGLQIQPEVALVSASVAVIGGTGQGVSYMQYCHNVTGTNCQGVRNTVVAGTVAFASASVTFTVTRALDTTSCSSTCQGVSYSHR